MCRRHRGSLWLQHNGRQEGEKVRTHQMHPALLGELSIAGEIDRLRATATNSWAPTPQAPAQLDSLSVHSEHMKPYHPTCDETWAPRYRFQEPCFHLFRPQPYCVFKRRVWQAPRKTKLTSCQKSQSTARSKRECDSRSHSPRCTCKSVPASVSDTAS